MFHDLATIFEDDDRIDPLNTPWVYYFFKADRNSKNWYENMKTVLSVDSVQDFWNVFGHLRPPSQLSYGCDYYMFRKGIQPMWEDESNKAGGMWSIPIHKSERDSHLNYVWQEVLLLLIGELFDASDEVCGASINVRGQFDKITIWTRDAKNLQANKEIGLKIREICGSKFKLEYFSHANNQIKASSSPKPLLVL